MNNAVEMLIVLVLIPVAALADDLAPPLPKGDVQDLVFLTPSSPLFIRLHLRIGNKGFRESRRDWVDALYEKCDIDRDGQLDATESARLPDLNVLLASPTVRQRTRVAASDTNSKEPQKFSSSQHLADYLAKLQHPSC